MIQARAGVLADICKINEGMIITDADGFLATHPNSVSTPIHLKAMPVILNNEDQINTWLTRLWEAARLLQQPLPDDQLMKLAA